LKDIEIEGNLPSLKISHISYTGAYPSPEMLEGYNRINPEFSERILVLVEETVHKSLEISTNESSAIIEQDKKIVDNDYSFRTRGQWLTVLLFVLVLSLAGLCIVFDKELASIAVVVSGFAAITVAAIKGVSGGK